VQAIAGAAWWIGVFTVTAVRDATLGGLNPVVLALLDIPLFVLASAVAAAGVKPAAVLATGWTGLVTIGLAVYATGTTEAGWGVVAMIGATAGSAAALCLMLLGRIPTEWAVRGPFAFRLAADAPTAATHTAATHMAATARQIAVFWGFFLVVLPLVAAALEHRWGLSVPFPAIALPVGVFVLTAASALGIASAYVMATLGGGTPLPSRMPNTLVIAGPYRWVRNPMALAGIVQGAAVGLLLSSWLVVGYAIAGSLVWNYVVRPHEEADLERRFGDQFRAYRRRVPRLPVRA
jgi:protein-S-isoprenylcysteine O-methyltransferase Ste14